ncbi:hypothetical protein O988_07239 [Pseudogymnoascus sp. VKM F-3808]|nr:hypothetical protein O988_07239 [Pseudogymnoascus sp. VKM F-3808]
MHYPIPPATARAITHSIIRPSPAKRTNTLAPINHLSAPPTETGDQHHRCAALQQGRCAQRAPHWRAWRPGGRARMERSWLGGGCGGGQFVLYKQKTMGWLGWAERVGRQGGRESRMGIPKLVGAWGSERRRPLNAQASQDSLALSIFRARRPAALS